MYPLCYIIGNWREADMNDHRLRVYDSILGLLSGADNPTPLVRLNRVTPFKHTQVYAKLEWYNPFGAVKDRIAANLVADAEGRELIGDDQKLVEPTSGNTGMALAMIANAKGYSLRTPLSVMIPQEKRTVLRFFGSDVIELQDTLCPAPGAPEGAIAMAMETAAQPDFHMLNQYENEANPEAHYKTTGPEIWKQTDGKVTHFVAGLGTCGTITGTGRFLKEQDAAIQVLGVHPEEGHDIPGVRSIRQLEQTKLYRPAQYDDTVEVANQAAFELCLRINREESIIAGPSSGMALAGAFKTVPDAPGNVAVVVFPDNAFKYASSLGRHLPQVRAQNTEMSLEEKLMAAMVKQARNEHLTIELDDAVQVIENEKPIVIDVRDFDTYRAAHLPGAKSVPIADIDDYAPEFPSDPDAPILTVCNRGNLSLLGVLYLASLGYRNARSLNGGTLGWIDRGYPVESI
jgi:cysteine synthase/rhodanese-related sulfurtransferase